MRMPSKETIEALRKAYPVGCTVELIEMDDPQAPKCRPLLARSLNIKLVFKI